MTAQEGRGTGTEKPRKAKTGCCQQRAATELCGVRLCDGGKGTVAGLNAKVGEHGGRSVANRNGG